MIASAGGGRPLLCQRVSERETSGASGASLRRGRWIAGAKAKARRREGKSPASVAELMIEMKFSLPQSRRALPFSTAPSSEGAARTAALVTRLREPHARVRYPFKSPQAICSFIHAQREIHSGMAGNSFAVRRNPFIPQG